MKKLLLAVLVLNGIIFEAVAAGVVTSSCLQYCLTSVTTYDSSCYDENCCANDGTNNLYGLITTSSLVPNCSQTRPSCTCKHTYSCKTGFYGTPTESNPKCYSCPVNADCVAGNNSTFVCKKGYYKNGTSCTRCPSSTDYKQNTGATLYGTTADVGATAMSECYLPKNTAYRDTNGNKFEATADCPYK